MAVFLTFGIIAFVIRTGIFKFICAGVICALGDKATFDSFQRQTIIYSIRLGIIIGIIWTFCTPTKHYIYFFIIIPISAFIFIPISTCITIAGAREFASPTTVWVISICDRPIPAPTFPLCCIFSTVFIRTFWTFCARGS